jgi:hypothetical protein
MIYSGSDVPGLETIQWDREVTFPPEYQSPPPPHLQYSSLPGATVLVPNLAGKPGSAEETTIVPARQTTKAGTGSKL